MFAQQGFDLTTLRALTTEAGVNLAAVHYHFGSKERLFEAVLTRLVGPINEERLARLDALDANLHLLSEPDEDPTRLDEFASVGVPSAEELASLFADRFFHADPHPGNLLWCDDKIYFLDFGMVGELGPDLRKNLMLLLLAFWQEDPAFMTDVTLMVSGGPEASSLARDTVFAAVMITTNGIVGIALLLGALKHGTTLFNAEGSGGALATVITLATLTLVLPTFTTTTPGPEFSGPQLAFAALASLALYAMFVFTQTVRHRDFFLPVTEDGVSVIALNGPEPIAIANVAVSDDPLEDAATRDVAITPDGSFLASFSAAALAT